MLELPMIPLVKGASTRLMRSALPCSPVVPVRPPGRLRLLAAGVLHRLATHLAQGLPMPPDARVTCAAGGGTN
ncbi:hypothetical protein FHR83_003543 [Actinoplanes campanulatus]|uniref:Uncharacterized protein n=1 Tax=Actinoplanes campanulatus TaxID=113559 RepID=A0A7W5FES5_9ACTN|nr:hypothetical protein [Actinoplanes campanulatus]MBB3095873.1 hypothetical protein [Actinoplanes campanulatus]GGN12151.1 hypothetical protein GCM10010109_22550 [Actinoplanes campanulatus]GID37033.1 hypothetical protein Aca09nite_35390 [Actinoplanes campanulatus]